MEKKDIDKKIEDLRKEFNNKIDQLKEDYKKEKSGKWIPKEDETYYYVLMDCLKVDADKWDNDKIDNTIIKYNKIFKTEEEAQEYADYLKAKKDYSYEFTKEEWEDIGINKYYIYYDYSEEKLEVFHCNYCGRLNQIYFKTKEKAQEFIDKYKKQILKFEFNIKEE